MNYLKHIWFVVIAIVLTVIHGIRAERVVTIYFLGTGIDSTCYEWNGVIGPGANVKWYTPELLSSLYRQDRSEPVIRQNFAYGTYESIAYTGWQSITIDPNIASVHYKMIIDGPGSHGDVLSNIDPDLGARKWDVLRLEAIRGIICVQNKYPGEQIILNIIGYSRGGIAAMYLEEAVAAYPYISKINMLCLEPVPGGIDPVHLLNGAKNSTTFSLSSKVNQYVGIYANDERTYQFEPVIPDTQGTAGTRVLTIKVPGTHETLVGNKQIGGHSIATYPTPLCPLWYLGFIQDERLRYVGDVTQIIAEQLIISPEWGFVPMVLSAINNQEYFNYAIDQMYSYPDYWFMHNFAILPLFGTYDLCFRALGKPHELRLAVPLPVFHGRLCFYGLNRHLPEWGWTWCPPFYYSFFNSEQVYWLDLTVPNMSIFDDPWETVQSFCGTNSSVDNVAPVPVIAELPALTGQCFITVDTKVAPKAHDNFAGIVNGTTDDPLTYTEQGEYTIYWTYDDGNGNTSTQEQKLIVKDDLPPLPDVEVLPELTGQCLVEVVDYPTATDNCAGTLDGMTTDPLTYTEQGTFTITWTFDDGNANATTQTQTVIVKDVTAPVPDVAALPKVTSECSATITTIPTATDNCTGVRQGTTADPLSYTEQGTFTVTWTFDDGFGNTAVQTQTVIVKDVTAPVPDVAALPKVTGECSATITTIPTATDNCTGVRQGTTADPLSYTEQGTFTVTWTFDDSFGNSTTQTQTVIVKDITPPVIENLSVTPNMLWPPNHKMVPVSVAADVSDNCDDLPVFRIISVVSNEPDNGSGGGNTNSDWQITGDLSADLRAERSGSGGGRIYTIGIECVDAVGNSTIANINVIVPHDQGQKKGKK